MNTRVLVLFVMIVALGARAVAADLKTSGANSPAGANSIQGKVVETMNAAGYTYLLVESGSKKSWAAVPEVRVKVGDTVVISEAMPMAKYHSKALNRTFDVVYFSGSVSVNGSTAAQSGASGAPAGHVPTAKGAPAFDLTNIAKAPGGKTVAEVHAAASALAGKKIAVRGRVVKYNSGIMGKNWMHIRDGSGAEGTNDLTVTSKATAKVGDLVVIEGVLATNRDFGGGYRYALIVEDASVTVETK
jgi:ribosomal protein S17